jgi:hypothetical protein
MLAPRLRARESPSDAPAMHLRLARKGVKGGHDCSDFSNSSSLGVGDLRRYRAGSLLKRVFG